MNSLLLGLGALSVVSHGVFAKSETVAHLIAQPSTCITSRLMPQVMCIGNQ